MSGMFNLKCPSCATELELEGDRQEWEGQVVNCPVCRTNLRISKAPAADPRMTMSPPNSRLANNRIRGRNITPPVEASTIDILFECPQCKKILCVSGKAVGMTLPCTGCETPVRVYKPFVRFTCVKCNRELSAFGNIKGKSTPCPNCQETITVPLPKMS